MSIINNVKKVATAKLCTSCGICKAICPVNCIELKIDKYGIFSPVIDDKCIHCGKCLNVCPGIDFDYQYFMRKIHCKVPENVILGPIIKSYVGYTSNKEVLNVSQSGGFVSELLIYGIEKQLFDGAVVTAWDEKDPFKPIVYIAKTKDEVLKAVGSKYNPIPVAAIVEELIKLEGRYVFVGTSCQIHGMRKAEEQVKGLSEKIFLYLGLHCLKVFNYYYHDQILHKINEKKENIKYFRFRDKQWRGWPCDMRLITKKNKIIDLTGEFSRLQARSYFSNWRCYLCFDKFNQFSDISCGDCRIHKHYGKDSLAEAYYSGIGKSDIVVRSARGDKILKQLINDRKLIVEESNVEDLIKTVAPAEKLIGLIYAKKIMSKFKKAIPNYHMEFLFDTKQHGRLRNIYSELVVLHYYFCHCFMRFKFFRFVLKLIPHHVLGKIAKLRDNPSIQYKKRKQLSIFLRGED